MGNSASKNSGAFAIPNLPVARDSINEQDGWLTILSATDGVPLKHVKALAEFLRSGDSQASISAVTAGTRAIAVKRLVIAMVSFAPKDELACWAVLFDALKANNSIEYLDLSFVRPSHGAWSIICNALASHKSIRTLNLTASLSNSFTDCTLDIFAAILTGNTCIETLIFSEPLPSERLRMLADTLRLNQSLKYLKILTKGEHRLDDAKSIATIIGTSGIARLCLVGNFFDIDGWHLIADALRTSKALTELEIHDTNIENDAVAKFADVLAASCPLKSLSIGNATLCVDLGGGWLAVARALAANRTLEHLRVANAQIPDRAALAFIESLKCNQTLSTLVLESALGRQPHLTRVPDAHYMCETIQHVARTKNYALTEVSLHGPKGYHKCRSCRTSMDDTLNAERRARLRRGELPPHESTGSTSGDTSDSGKDEEEDGDDDSERDTKPAS